MKRSLILLVCSLVMALASCDKCKDVACINGGDCSEGKCVCPTGFSGDDCSIEDKCLTGSLTCFNGGDCEDGECECEDGYSGDFCEDEDLCVTQDVDCQNGGTCSNGVCDCPSGYSGSDCSIIDRSDWLGTYYSDDDCGFVYNNTIVNGSEENTIDIQTFGGFSSTVTGTLTSLTSMVVEEQEDGVGRKFSGSGTLNAAGDQIDLTYTVVYPDLSSETCNVEMTK